MAELTLFLASPIVEPPREVGATMSRLLYRLGAVCVRRKYLALLVWAFVVAAVAAGVLVFGARTNNDIRLPGTDAQRASDLLSREVPPQQNGQSPIVFHASRGTITDAASKRAVQASLSDITHTAHVSSVIGPFSRAGKTLMSADGKTAIAQVLLDANGGQVTRELASKILAAAGPARRAGIQVDAGEGVEESIARTMATSGTAVVFAGGTVIIALLSLLVARVPILGAMGYAAAIVVLVAVLTAVTLLPAILA